MKLHYRKLGSGQPLFILHGLFGYSDNWQTIGKQLAEDFEVYLVDQRNHGHSPHSDAFSYQLMAQDLHELISELGLSNVILMGHSMGGKTIMRLAQQHAELIKKMVVVDMGVKAYPVHHDRILEGLNAIDLDAVSSRGEADDILSEYVPEFGIRQFLLKNLYWIEPGKQLGWRINIPVLTNKIEEITEALPHKTVDVDILFIRGEKSNYILESDYEDIKGYFPKADFTTIHGAGHWIHAEKPEEFYQAVMKYIGV